MRRSVKYVYLLSAAVMGGTVSAPANAQDMAIETVTVTAQKRAQNEQDVPISMSVLSGNQLENFQQSDLHSLMDSVPNLFVERILGSDVVYIRGFGSGATNFAFDQSVSMYQDGIYGGRGRQFEAPFFDLERLEVLRGPQGALFGKNTAAGAISVITKGATDTFEASISASYNFGLNGTEVSGYVSGPLTDTLKARFAVSTTDTNGYILNVNSNSRDPKTTARLGRLTLEFTPSESISIVGKAEYSGKGVRGSNIVLAPIATGYPISTVRYSDSNPFGVPEANNVTARNGSVTANIQIGDHTLTSVTGYSSFRDWRANSFSTDIPALYSNSFSEKFDQFSQEFRLMSPTGQALEYVVGLYFDTSDYILRYQRDYDFTSLSLPVVGQLYSDFVQTADSYSAFGQATYHVLDTLRAIGSLRWTHVNKNATFDAILAHGAPFGVVSAARGSLGEENVDPSFTMQYDVADNVMLYGVWGRGSKSGGFVSNTFGTTDATFKFAAERSTNVEGGIKSTLLDGSLMLNVSIYNTVFNNLQSSIFDSSIVGFITANAAKATSRGVEAMSTWRPLMELTLTASGAYQDAKYNDFPGAACLASQAVSCNALTNNLAGRPLTFASTWTGNLQADYRTPAFEGTQFGLTGVATYRSKYFNADNQSTVYGIQPGYAKYNLRAELTDNNDRWTVAVVGKNLTDVRTYNFAFVLGVPITANPRVHEFVEEPRTVSVEATLRF